MTPAEIDLARRAVACKRWRRMPGMRWVGSPGGRWPEDRGESVRIVGADEWPSNAPREAAGPDWQPGPESLPDLADPATLGCLQHLAREAHCDPTLAAVYFEEFDRGRGRPKGAPSWRSWRILANGGAEVGSGVTQAEAWVEALEAAP